METFTRTSNHRDYGRFFMMSDPTNAARSLLDIYDSLREAWANDRSALGLKVFRSAYAGFREPDAPEDESAFLAFVAEVFSLPNEVIRELEAQGAHELEWAGPDLLDIRNGMSMRMLLENVSQSEPWLNDAHRKSILAAVTALNQSNEWREERVPIDVVMTLLKTVRDLRDQVLDGDELSADLRSWLITMISDIETALAQYRIGGARGLRHALESATGHIVLNPQVAKAVEKSSKGLWQRTLSVLITLERTVLFAAGAAYLGSLAPGVPWHDAQPVEAVIRLLPALIELESSSHRELNNGDTGEKAADDNDPTADDDDSETQNNDN